MPNVANVPNVRNEQNFRKFENVLQQPAMNKPCRLVQNHLPWDQQDLSEHLTLHKDHIKFYNIL